MTATDGHFYVTLSLGNGADCNMLISGAPLIKTRVSFIYEGQYNFSVIAGTSTP